MTKLAALPLLAAVLGALTACGGGGPSGELRVRLSLIDSDALEVVQTTAFVHAADGSQLEPAALTTPNQSGGHIATQVEVAAPAGRASFSVLRIQETDSEQGRLREYKIESFLGVPAGDYSLDRSARDNRADCVSENLRKEVFVEIRNLPVDTDHVFVVVAVAGSLEGSRLEFVNEPEVPDSFLVGPISVCDAQRLGVANIAVVAHTQGEGAGSAGLLDAGRLRYGVLEQQSLVAQMQYVVSMSEPVVGRTVRVNNSPGPLDYDLDGELLFSDIEMGDALLEFFADDLNPEGTVIAGPWRAQAATLRQILAIETDVAGDSDKKFAMRVALALPQPDDISMDLPAFEFGSFGVDASRSAAVWTQLAEVRSDIGNIGFVTGFVEAADGVLERVRWTAIFDPRVLSRVAVPAVDARALAVLANAEDFRGDLVFVEIQNINDFDSFWGSGGGLEFLAKKLGSRRPENNQLPSVGELTFATGRSVVMQEHTPFTGTITFPVDKFD